MKAVLAFALGAFVTGQNQPLPLPAQPARPAQPALPAQPARPAQPALPAKPAQPALGQAAQPAQPAQPASKPSTVPPPSTLPATPQNAANPQERSLIFENPVLDVLAMQALAPKPKAGEEGAATSSSSDMTNTLLMASMFSSSNGGGGLFGGQQQQRPRRSSRQPQYAPQYGQPQYGASMSTQFGSSSRYGSQPQYFQSQPQYAPPQRSSYNDDSYYYDSGRGYNGYGNQRQQEDPLKKMVILQGVTSGSVSPFAAVAMDNNKGVSSTDALVMSSMGQSPLTNMMAMGAFGGGSSNGMGGSGALQTLMVANALSPKKEGEAEKNPLSTLATVAMLGGMNSMNGGGSRNGW